MASLKLFSSSYHIERETVSTPTRKLLMVTHVVFFISENLTKYRTELVKKLSQLKYSKQIYTYWTSDGRIYVKQTETSRKQTVNNFDDIMNFERSNQQHTSFKSSGIEEL